MFETTLVLCLFAMMAAQGNAPDALAKGDAAAKALLDDGIWPVTRYAGYLSRSVDQRLLFWKSGAALVELQGLATLDAAWNNENLVALVDKARLLYLEEYAKQIQEGQIPPPADTPVTELPPAPPPPPPDTGGGIGMVLVMVLLGGGLLWGGMRLLGGR